MKPQNIKLANFEGKILDCAVRSLAFDIQLFFFAWQQLPNDKPQNIEQANVRGKILGPCLAEKFLPR